MSRMPQANCVLNQAAAAEAAERARHHAVARWHWLIQTSLDWSATVSMVMPR